jgi:hypothetical protein
MNLAEIESLLIPFIRVFSPGAGNNFPFQEVIKYLTG